MIRRRYTRPSDWMALWRAWAIACVAIGACVGFATADELRITREARMPTAWLTGCLGACVLLILVGCAGAIVLERER